MISITNENNKTEDVLVFCAEVLWEELLNKKLLEFSKDKMKSFMSMSHELRTPLNCSPSMLSILEENLVHPNFNVN